MGDEKVLELLRRECTSAEYQRIREQWKAHSIAEDNRSIPGLLATLTPDCLYEVVPTGDSWHGREGAAAFYAGLLQAFPDIKFQLTNIVIGPQGVFEEARVTATHQRDWLAFPATGKAIGFGVGIFFPWDPAQGRFLGERIYFDRAAVRP